MYAYEHAFSDEEVEDWLERQLERYRRDGFGLWAVERRDTGEFLGQTGLTWPVSYTHLRRGNRHFQRASFVQRGYRVRRGAKP